MLSSVATHMVETREEEVAGEDRKGRRAKSRASRALMLLLPLLVHSSRKSPRSLEMEGALLEGQPLD